MEVFSVVSGQSASIHSFFYTPTHALPHSPTHSWGHRGLKMVPSVRPGGELARGRKLVTGAQPLILWSDFRAQGTLLCSAPTPAQVSLRFVF